MSASAGAEGHVLWCTPLDSFALNSDKSWLPGRMFCPFWKRFRATRSFQLIRNLPSPVGQPQLRLRGCLPTRLRSTSASTSASASNGSGNASSNLNLDSTRTAMTITAVLSRKG